MSKALLEYAVPWLVDNPESVEIEELESEQGGTILELSVHPDDVGKVIGKRGRIIRSLRALAKAAGQKQGTSVSVEVVD